MVNEITVNYSPVDCVLNLNMKSMKRKKEDQNNLQSELKIWSLSECVCVCVKSIKFYVFYLFLSHIFIVFIIMCDIVILKGAV